jgi:serine/threonine protein phosphatase PrpC
MVSDLDIKTILKDRNTSGEICQSLVDAALAGGGKDNITVISASYQIPERE